MLEGYSSPVLSIAFLPNGKQIISILHDKTVQLWDIITGALLQTFKSHSSSVLSIAFLSNNKLVLTFRILGH